MRIAYNILWFENDEGWLNQAEKGIKNLLDDFGFKLNADKQSDGSKLEEIIKGIQLKVIDIDMIFMDFKLSGGVNGDKLIEVIRNKNLYTEILFYSQNENVKQIIEDACGSVEGIYYAGRDNFRDKAKEVIWHTIKKVEDVESMRGLIMGAVSHIDEMMVEIVTDYIDRCSDENREKIGSELFDKIGQYLNMKKEQFDTILRKKKINHLIKDPLLFDADKKAIATQAIINLINHEDLNSLIGEAFYNSYKTNVIKTRNNFAHVTVVVEDGNRKLKSKSTEEIFSDERCIQIRKSLIEHMESVNRIKNYLPK